MKSLRRKTNRRRVPIRVRLAALTATVRAGIGRIAPYVLAVALFGAVPYVVYLGYQHVVSSQYFAATTIEVSGLERVDRDELLRGVGVLEGMNVFDVDADRVEEAAISMAWIKKASVEVKLPNRVTIKVEEKTPVAIAAYEKEHWYVDATGSMIEPGAALTEDTPLLTGLDAVDVSVLSARIRDGIEIAEHLAEMKSKKDTVNVSASEIHFETVLGYSVVLLNGVEIRMGFDRFGERLRRAVRVLEEAPEKVSYVLVDHGLHSNRVIVGQ